MYINEINKDTIFVKLVGDDKNFLVDIIEQDGIKTIRTTKNILKAAHFKAQEAYAMVYNDLSAEDREQIIRAHQKNDAYNTLTYNLRHQFAPVTIDSINYGYSEDVKAEQKLLSSFDMNYVFTPDEFIIQSMDEEDK